jgi:hypothetical protein
MLLLDDSELLFKHRNDYQFVDYLKNHLKHIHTFQYQSENHIRSTCGYLSKELTKFVKASSPIYRSRKIVDKSILDNKKEWYVPGLRGHSAATGGSTTGNKFEYLRWADVYHSIEGDIHYKAILQEFGLDRPINILYMMLDKIEDRSTTKLTNVYTTTNIMISHGQTKSATVHEVIRNKQYHNDYFGFYEDIFNYCIDQKIDVILAPGQVISSLAWNARRIKQQKQICHLISNTGDRMHLKDVISLKNTGVIGNWCDHMRCWDGGITFMTCKFGTYHLLDGLAWTRSDENDRLISDDYYSLPSPFVNYWNGDFGTVGTTYHKCKCGRMYRDFTIKRIRSVIMSGVHNTTIRDNILATDVDTSGIKRAEASDYFLRLFTDRPYSPHERLTIRRTLPNLEINFITEEPNE